MLIQGGVSCESVTREWVPDPASRFMRRPLILRDVAATWLIHTRQTFLKEC